MNFYSFSCVRFPVGAVVGGIVGGLFAVAAIIGALLYFCRKRPTSAEFSTQPNQSSPDSQPPPSDMVHVPVTPSLYSTTPLYPNHVPHNNAQPRNSNPSPSSDFLTPTTATDFDNGRDSAISSHGEDPNAGGTLSSKQDSPNDRNSPNQLTDEEATYVQNMYSLNVPAPAIALVVERMLQEGGRTGESSTGSVGFRRGNTTATMPPSYTDI
jgi:hypothetical protein